MTTLMFSIEVEDDSKVERVAKFVKAILAADEIEVEVWRLDPVPKPTPNPWKKN